MLAKQLQGAAKGVAVDSDFENVTLLLHGNGTNGAQNNTFLDSSTNNFTITRNGNTTQGTFSPYGDNWSNYFDGTGDFLTVPDNAAFDLGSGDFTVEAWLYITSGNTSGAGWLSQWSTGTTQGWYFGTSSSPTSNIFLFGYTTNGSTVNVISSGYDVTTTLNQWVHFAVSKSGTSVRLFVNGTQQGSTGTLSGTIFNSSDNLVIGRNGSFTSGWDLIGYMSNARLVKGTALYTSNFTPPTAPLTAITNTSLLTCQSNRFIDNSTNAFTITRNGDVSVQRFSPFSPTAAYASGTIGGSGYFDGTGDSLEIADSTTWDLGSGNFTFECWFYPLVSGETMALGGNWSNTSQANRSYLFYVTGNVAYFLGEDGSTQPTASSASSVIVNAWNHIAAVRNGTSLRVYLNGVSGTSTTLNPFTFQNSNLPFRIGSQSQGASNSVTGYISDFRFVKGSAVYTGGFTPPTSPLTAITNTQLLTNFTNAGIIDNAMMNDLETVGNAQISTTQSKFGGSSMYFDGTGDYLVGNFATKDLYNFGTGNFTVEMWVYTSNLSNYQTLLDTRASDSQTAWCLFIDNTGKPYWYDASGVQLSSTAISSNTWTHLAIARSGSTLKMFLSGTEVFSGTNTNSQNSTGTFYVGRNAVNAFLYTGYIDDLRITKGVARYTANFTAPTAPFADQ